jgi:hypothetical protein
MTAFFWVKRYLVAAYFAFGSASVFELAEIAILCLLGMIASVLVMTPGDQTLDGIFALCRLLLECN